MSVPLSAEELLAKMMAHLKERRAVYDALVDNPDRQIADAEVEALQLCGSVDKTNRCPQLESDYLEETAYQWSNVIGRKINTALPGRLAMALLRLDDCNYDHDCGGEGDYPRCKECRAVRIMRGLIVELGAHGIGHEGLTP